MSAKEDVAARRGLYATQVGTYRDNHADRALDGNTNPDLSAGYCAWTHQSGTRVWWMVDLGSQHAIYSIIVYSSSFPEYLGYISVRVSDSAAITEHTESDQCALWDYRTFPQSSSQTLECDQVMYGRYVSLERTAGSYTSYMILCEVMVMGRQIETECSNCNDNPCTSDSPCTECKPGFRPVECREPIHLRLPKDRPLVRSVTGSSAVIKWKKIVNVTDHLSGLYEYVFEYVEGNSYNWTEAQTRYSHDNSSDQHQENTLTGLKYGTRYRVRIRSYWILEDQRDQRGCTYFAGFKTLCMEPKKPENMTLTREENEGRVDLMITWKVPQYSDCRRINRVYIQFGLISESEENWRSYYPRSASTSATLPNLDPGHYVVRLVVEDAGGRTNYRKKATGLNTDCSQCADSQCTIEDPCQACKPGFKRLECRNACDSGYYGVECEEECSVGCQDACDRVSGECSCKDWWEGNKCITEIPCNSGYYGVNCEEECSVGCQDACDRVSGECSCMDWWEGNECTMEIPCESGYYGVNCEEECSVGCEVKCTRDSGECSCKDWWDGNKCTTEIPCNSGYYGVNCEEECSVGCQDACGRVSGECSCKDWWDGNTCTIEIPCDSGYYGVLCEEECSVGCEDACDRVSGECSCKDWWDGNKCTVEIPCDSGYHGVNCKEECSVGCEDTCDIVSGECSCKDWWDGNKCTIEIKPLSLPDDSLTVSKVRESSAVITWKKITNVPDGLSDHYQYAIEYREETSSSWLVWQSSHSHDPSSDHHQNDTLADLMYDTVYRVQVKSYRIQGTNREKTGRTDHYSFKTKCRDGKCGGNNNIALITGIVNSAVISLLAGAVGFLIYRNRQSREEIRRLKEQSELQPAQPQSDLTYGEAESSFIQGTLTDHKPPSVAMETPNLDDVCENLYEKPIASVYEAIDDLTRPRYLAVGVPEPPEEL